MEKRKKIVYRILYIFAFILVIYNLLFLSNTVITRQEYLDLFGFCIIPKKDVIITREVKTDRDIQVGDTLVYYQAGSIKIGTVINTYIDIDTIETNYTIKTEKNLYPDTLKISNNQIIGKRINKIDNLGFIVGVLQSRVFSLMSIVFLFGNLYYNQYSYRAKIRRNLKKTTAEKEIK